MSRPAGSLARRIDAGAHGGKRVRMTDDDDARRRRGRSRRAQVLGEAYVAAAEARATDFTQPFQDLVNRHAWGDVWSRPGLDDQTRRLITIALLGSMALEEEVKLHVRAARDAGVSPALIAEALLHMSVYAGVPKANAAFRWAQQALADVEVSGSPQRADSAAPGC
jgi:3-oxoadipate enol-lactonase/4-carboxymuconolactone decarboxylase